MHTRLLMSASAAFLLALGLFATFAHRSSWRASAAAPNQLWS